METKFQPELTLNRKICESCGESTFEFAPDTSELQEYVCTNCSI